MFDSINLLLFLNKMYVFFFFFFFLNNWYYFWYKIVVTTQTIIIGNNNSNSTQITSYNHVTEHTNYNLEISILESKFKNSSTIRSTIV